MATQTNSLNDLKSIERPDHIGVVNPYALVEKMLGKTVNWGGVHDTNKLLSDTLGMPYEKLFDPINNSPLYAGMKVDTASKIISIDNSNINASKAHAAAVNVVPSVVWADPGSFFKEAADMTDPIQGALADCYFISALSSVAWARTYVIAQRSRQTGDNLQNFVDMIQFFKAGATVNIETTENLPLMSLGNSFIYCRSAQSGEIWPALYEKAYVFFRKSGTGICDTLAASDYNIINYGDPVAAVSTLTNLTPYYYGNSGMSENDIWSTIRANSVSLKTFNPMVAWTYGTAPAGVNYATAHIVANHAYSILGWQTMNNQNYVVLRNPWGNTEATLNVAGGTWTAWDAPYYGGPGRWRPIALTLNDGIFALRVDSFKAMFAGFGLCK